MTHGEKYRARPPLGVLRVERVEEDILHPSRGPADTRGQRSSAPLTSGWQMRALGTSFSGNVPENCSSLPPPPRLRPRPRPRPLSGGGVAPLWCGATWPCRKPAWSTCGKASHTKSDCPTRGTGRCGFGEVRGPERRRGIRMCAGARRDTRRVAPPRPSTTSLPEPEYPGQVRAVYLLRTQGWRCPSSTDN